MNHLGAVVDSNLDDLVASEVGTDGGVLPALANDVRLIGLCCPLVSGCFSWTKRESGVGEDGAYSACAWRDGPHSYTISIGTRDAG